MEENDKKDVVTTSTLKFCEEELEVSILDRTDPIFLLYLSQIEHVELYNGDGLLWYKHLRENYGIRFGSEKIETRIENILVANKRQGMSNGPSLLDKKRGQ